MSNRGAHASVHSDTVPCYSTMPVIVLMGSALHVFAFFLPGVYAGARDISGARSLGAPKEQ
jgi:hypothetical protein